MKKALNLFVTIILIILSFSISLSGCNTNSNKQTAINEWKALYDMNSFGILNEDNPLCEINLSTGDSIRLELYISVAPESVNNFIKLANSGFYEGIVFHRIIAGFMIQAGGFEIKDNCIVQKESPYGTIKGEFIDNGVANSVRHSEGVISMARANNYDSGSSQFFICSNDCSDSLDGLYAAFGRVIDKESMKIVVKLSQVKTSNNLLYYGNTPYYASDVPVEIISITSIDIYQ